jgi:hypothetical protein
VILPCWRVDARAPRESGVLGHFRSRPLSYTAARSLVYEFEATGTPVTMEPIEELMDLNRQIIRGTITPTEAISMARSRGFLTG